MMKVMKGLALTALLMLGAQSAFAGPVPAGTKMDDHIYLNLVTDGEPTSFDVSRATDSAAFEIMGNCLQGLVMNNVNATHDGIEQVGGDAESWTVSDDGTVWTFKLKEDAVWADGKPVTAHDYVYSFRRTADPKTGSPSSWYMTPIKNAEKVMDGEVSVEELGIRAIDDKTLEITLEEPNVYFKEMLSNIAYFPQRQDKVEEWGDKYGTEAKYFIGNGPFELAEWVHNSKIVMKKSDTFNDKANVYPEKIDIIQLHDSQAVRNAMFAGQIDLCGAESPEDIDRYTKEGFVVTSIPGVRVKSTIYNTQDKIFGNAKVRKAFALATDRETLVELLWGGLADAQKGYIPAGINVEEQGNFRELNGDLYGKLMDDLKAEGKTPKDLLIEGMQELGLGDDPSTLDVTMLLCGTSTWDTQMADYFIDAFANELGVKLKVDKYEFGIALDKMGKGEYQLAYLGWGADFNDPFPYLEMYHSDFDYNFSFWKNEKYDDLIEAARKEFDAHKRNEMLMQAEKLLISDEMVVQAMVSNRVELAMRPEIKNYPLFPFNTEGYRYVYTDGRK